MDSPPRLSPSTPRLVPGGHMRSASRSPTRPRITDDLLSDLSPTTTLEAFTSHSGRFKTSIEAATPTERAFGIRATLASKKIEEWVDELSHWPWPAGGGAAGFEQPAAKRRKVSTPRSEDPGAHTPQNGYNGRLNGTQNRYIGSLLAQDVVRYETRIDEITEDMDELNVEEIKTQVLDTHFSARSRPSSSHSNRAAPGLLAPYTRMDDFTAIVTAIVLQALPNLSKLMRLMDVWSVRLTVLRKVPPLLLALDDTEVALRSGWQAIQITVQKYSQGTEIKDDEVLSRQTFHIMRDVLQDKVTKLGQELDFMLDSLEGREDTLPEVWLDRMEAIEQDYGEWVVCGDRKVREGEWAMMARARKQLEDDRKAMEAAAAAEAAEEEKKSYLRKDENSRASETATADIPATETEETTSQELETQEPQALEPETQDRLISRRDSQISEKQGIGTEEPQFQQAGSPQLETTAVEIPATKNQQVETQNEEQTEQLRTQEPETQAPEDHEIEAPSLPKEDTATNGMISAAVGALAGTAAGIAAGFHLKSEKLENDQSPDPFEIVKSAASPTSKFAAADPFNGAKETSANDIVEQLPISTATETPTEAPHQPQHDEIRKFVDNVANSEFLITPNNDGISTASHDEQPVTLTTPSESRADDGQTENAEQASETDNKLRTRPIDLLLGDGAQDEMVLSSDDTVAYTGAQIPVAEMITINPDKYYPKTNIESREPATGVYDANREKPSLTNSSVPKRHKRNISVVSAVSGYATSHPTPEIQEAEPAAYLRPVLSPISGTHALENMDSRTPTAPTFEPFSLTPRDVAELEPAAYSQPTTEPVASTVVGATIDNESNMSTMPTSEPREPTGSSPFVLESSEPFALSKPNDDGVQEDSTEISFNNISTAKEIADPVFVDGTSENLPTDSEFYPLELDSRRPSTSSVGFIAHSDINRVWIPREDSISSDTSTIMTGRRGSTTVSPVRVSSPYDTNASSPISDKQPSLDVDDQSPSAGRVGLRGKSHDYSPPGSPIGPAQPHPLHVDILDLSEEPEDAPSTPRLPPILDNVGLSASIALSSPSQTTDDQMQQQISSILQSIPARIRLTSEPDTNPPDSYSLQSKKKRSPPNYRPLTSLSMSRAPTPSFTLAPAYAKNPRPRPQNGNPEIKLYHLSRSTGEAPIKLFVRLVGEHGERVMVRVGGGWADLGEYLKEYAAHHGRRSGSGVGPESKVEIQDLPGRIASSSSITVKNTSPTDRPASALDRERPGSSLAVRKTRRSLGVADEPSSSVRLPSTPLPSYFSSSAVRANESTTTAMAMTPTSTTSDRSVNRLSWTEEDSSLGLAGPKGRKMDHPLSPESAAWVESVKEKVRMASAEKEKRTSSTSNNFGEMARVGGTKRLFKKG